MKKNKNIDFLGIRFWYKYGFQKKYAVAILYDVKHNKSIKVTFDEVVHQGKPGEYDESRCQPK